ncbi:MAG: acyltransferase [Myxococcaceae bacterium]
MSESVWSKLTRVVSEELHALNPRLEAVSALSKLIPGEVGGEVRARLLEQVGFEVGEGTQVHGQPRITGGVSLAQHLHVGRECVIDVGCTFDLEHHITLEDQVTLGPQVMILTSTHELGPPEHRAGNVTRSPVTVQRGAWVGARAIILPGVTVGAGAVVQPGSLVNKDVPPNARVGGSPARVLETLAP